MMTRGVTSRKRTILAVPHTGSSGPCVEAVGGGPEHSGPKGADHRLTFGSFGPAAVLVRKFAPDWHKAARDHLVKRHPIPQTYRPDVIFTCDLDGDNALTLFVTHTFSAYPFNRPPKRRFVL